ncbi:DNAJ protein JJJ1 homolog [Phragmites australis]|uniref:DNAJ protein JJJ1 homolog n=1 Tax=Phragmites australis TaxID=29695 RepID=UPI002D799525|nr:DNAJ protein JJJ1 homolog [Phragmites australis]
MAAAAAGAPKRCYYEVLGLPRDCSLTDIKLAFRRLALSLHPDKQPPGSDIAAATAAFQELQHAHSVLSDPQERAYYDSHRSQILFADLTSSGAASASASPIPDLFAFFSSSAFSGFSDTGRGFFKVYGDVFGRVFAQELAYARRMGVPEPPAPPVIGNLDSPYAQVTAFYNYWLGFRSVMDFGWAAEWDATRGENRRVRRLMEEDNKKAMHKARREYNDTVRGLAAFCKKRDKRVVDMALKKKAEEEKKKAEEKERKKEEEKRKKERAMAYQEPEWARVEEEAVFDDEEEEMRAKRKEELYCVACNKKFKSDKQWKNHEQSKKHRDKIAELRMAFKEEEEVALKEAREEVEGDWNEVDVGFDFKPTQESDESEWSDAAEELAEELGEGLKVHDKEDDDKDFANADQEVGSYDETSVLEAMLSSRKNRKGGHVVPPEEALSDNAEYEDDDKSSEFNNVKRKGRRRLASKKEQDEGTYADNEQRGKSVVQPEESGHDNVDDKMEGPSSSNEDGVLEGKGDQQKGKNSNPKKNKKNKKGAEKKTTVSAGQKSTSKGKKLKEASKAPSNDCETCGGTFESRNKLFSHLEETGHAMLKARQRNH